MISAIAGLSMVYGAAMMKWGEPGDDVVGFCAVVLSVVLFIFR